MLARALRERLASGYAFGDFRADVLAGCVVGIIALPLAMALAIASGVPPQYGLYTSIVAGTLCALFGGSRLNVSGPTAAFVALLVPITTKFGLAGLLLATAMAGVILIVMGVAKLGKLIEFVPHPVTTGFTSGIAVVIATLQVKDFFGLQMTGNPEHYWDRVADLAHAFPTANLPDVTLGAIALLVLIVWPKVTKRIPAPLVAVPLAAVLGVLLPHVWDGFSAATIGSRFSFVDASGVSHAGVPTSLPHFGLPWNAPGPNGEPLGLDFKMIEELMMAAFAIAMLGAIESLLCAVVSDSMAGTRSDPDSELLGQGIGNLVAPFFGGIAATGAIARTAMNVRAGARSPIAAIVHAGFVLAAMLAIGPWLSYVPMAALAALLMMAAWHMSDMRHFIRIVRVAPRSDTFVLLVCFGLTVVFDMVIAVGVGIVLAALMFMRRMVEITSTRILDERGEHEYGTLPQGVVVYDIAGPLFFGAAEKATRAMARVPSGAKTVILELSGVPAMDVTGLVALESAVVNVQKLGARVIFAGVLEQPRRLIAKAFATGQLTAVPICDDVQQAVAVATEQRD